MCVLEKKHNQWKYAGLRHLTLLAAAMVVVATGSTAWAAAPSGGFIALMDQQNNFGDSRRSIVFYDADDLTEPLFAVFVGHKTPGDQRSPDAITSDPDGNVYFLAIDRDADEGTIVNNNPGVTSVENNTEGDYDLLRINFADVYDEWQTNQGSAYTTFNYQPTVLPVNPLDDGRGHPSGGNTNEVLFQGAVTKLGEVARQSSNEFENADFFASHLEYVDEDTFLIVDAYKQALDAVPGTLNPEQFSQELVEARQDLILDAQADNRVIARATNDATVRILKRVTAPAEVRPENDSSGIDPGPYTPGFLDEGGFNQGTTEAWESTVLGQIHLDNDPIADFDDDGDTDLDDYNIQSSNMYTTSGMTKSDGDTDGDGDVDFEDFVTMALHQGEFNSRSEINDIEFVHDTVSGTMGLLIAEFDGGQTHGVNNNGTPFDQSDDFIEVNPSSDQVGFFEITNTSGTSGNGLKYIDVTGVGADIALNVDDDPVGAAGDGGGSVNRVFFDPIRNKVIIIESGFPDAADVSDAGTVVTSANQAGEDLIANPGQASLLWFQLDLEDGGEPLKGATEPSVITYDITDYDDATGRMVLGNPTITALNPGGDDDDDVVTDARWAAFDPAENIVYFYDLDAQNDSIRSLLGINTGGPTALDGFLHDWYSLDLDTGVTTRVGNDADLSNGLFGQNDAIEFFFIAGEAELLTPEPGTLALLALGVAALWRRQRD